MTQEISEFNHLFWDVKSPPSSTLGIWLNDESGQWYYDALSEEDWNIQPMRGLGEFFKLQMITDTESNKHTSVMMPGDATIKRIVDEIYRSYCATGTFRLEQYTLFGGLNWNERTKTAHVVLKFAG